MVFCIMYIMAFDKMQNKHNSIASLIGPWEILIKF